MLKIQAVEIDGVTYEIQDSTAREEIEALKTDVQTMKDNWPTGEVGEVVDETARAEIAAHEAEEVIDVTARADIATLKQYVPIPQTTSLPTASEKYHGMFYIYVNGNTTSLEICLKSNGSYSWKKFGTLAFL